MSRYQGALDRLEKAGTDTTERGQIFAAMLEDDEMIVELATMSRAQREAAITNIGGLLKRSGRLQTLRDLVIEKLRERVAEGGGHRCFGLPMPDDYHINDKGWLVRPVITKDGSQTDLIVARRPIGVTGILRDPSDQKVHVEVSWATSTGEVERAVVPRGVIADGRAMVAALSEIGEDGAPVNSKSAGAVVEYLAAQEHAAAGDIPRATLTKRLGWVDDGKGGDLGFMAGHFLVREGRSVLPEEVWGDRHVILDPDPGLQAVAHRFRPGGTMEGWKAAVTPVACFPVAMLAIVQAVAPVLLGVIPEPTCAGILDISGPPQTGKTAAMNLGLSCWGVGDAIRGPARSWDDSAAGLREYAVACNHMLVAINETQHKKDQPEDLIRWIYAFFEGGARIVSQSGGGIRAGKDFRSGAIVTGEQPIISYGDEAGTRSRVLSITSLPFGDKTREKQEVLAGLHTALLEHYGHAGPAVAMWLDDHRRHWPELRRRWSAGTTRWSVDLGGGCERAAEVLSLYEITASIIQRVLGLPIDVDAIMAAAAKAAQSSAADADLGLRALRRVTSWAASQQSAFAGRSDKPPQSGWLGRWEVRPGASLALVQEPLCDMLRRRGMQVEGVIKAWHDNGWLEAADGRRTKKVSIGNARPRCYVLSADALRVAGVESTASTEEAA